VDGPSVEKSSLCLEIRGDVEENCLSVMGREADSRAIDKQFLTLLAEKNRRKEFSQRVRTCIVKKCQASARWSLIAFSHKCIDDNEISFKFPPSLLTTTHALAYVANDGREAHSFGVSFLNSRLVGNFYRAALGNGDPSASKINDGGEARAERKRQGTKAILAGYLRNPFENESDNSPCGFSCFRKFLHESRVCVFMSSSALPALVSAYESRSDSSHRSVSVTAKCNSLFDQHFSFLSNVSKMKSQNGKDHEGRIESRR